MSRFAIDEPIDRDEDTDREESVPCCGECERSFLLMEPRGASRVRVARREDVPVDGSTCARCSEAQLVALHTMAAVHDGAAA